MKKFLFLSLTFLLVTFGFVSASSAIEFTWVDPQAGLLGGNLEGDYMPDGITLADPTGNDSLENVNLVIDYYQEKGWTIPDATVEFKVEEGDLGTLNGVTSGTIDDLMGAYYLSLKFGNDNEKSGGGWLLWDIHLLAAAGESFSFDLLYGDLAEGETVPGLSHYTLWNPGTVPEPATLFLLGTGLVGLAVTSRKNFKK